MARFCSETEMDQQALRFCGYCGGRLKAGIFEGRLRKKCQSCGRINYQNPIPSVALLATKESDQVLLVRRLTEPAIGHWCLPGGFIELGETPVNAVHRELLEETGLRCTVQRLFDVGTVIKGYYGDVIVLAYLIALLEGDPVAGDDADEVKFFSTRQLPPLAFRCHLQFIERLFQNKIDQHPEH